MTDAARDEFTDLYEARARAHEALEDHWRLQWVGHLGPGGYTQTGSVPGNHPEWLARYSDLRAHLEAADEALLAYLRERRD